MDGVRRSIIATLAYYDGFRRPLTVLELHKWLIPASRLGGVAGSPSLSRILADLDLLVADGIVQSSLGMYALASADPKIFAERVLAEKVCAQKWRGMRRSAWWLQSVPYVRMLCASGSLTLGNVDSQSDWDVFVVARAGRLYTVRFLLLGVAYLMRKLRTKRDSVAPDKFCFNHYVTTDGLLFRHRSLFTARALVLLTPVIGRDEHVEQLWNTNRWIHSYGALPSKPAYIRRLVERSGILDGVRRIGEWMLDGTLGNLLEKILCRWQQRRIMHDPRTAHPRGRIVADSREIEFHPDSYESAIMRRYNDTLQRYGLGQFLERDSGLQ